MRYRRRDLSLVGSRLRRSGAIFVAQQKRETSGNDTQTIRNSV
jgi:hypothetical protein